MNHTTSPMSFYRLIARSLAYHRRMHMGLLLGVMLACGILTGALLVGGSVDYSLREIATSRLGRVAYAMNWTNRFFGQTLADTLREQDSRVHASAVLTLRGMLRLPAERQAQASQINRVQVYGIDPGFREFSGDAGVLGPQKIAVNEKAARTLNVKPGDDLQLRMVRASVMPMDAPLSSRKEQPVITRIVTVKAVLSDAQLGRFSLAANQTTPYNVFVDRAWLQEQMELGGLANLMVAGDEIALNDLHRTLGQSWNLEDTGLRLRSHTSGLLQLESTRIFLDEEVVRAAMEIPGASPTLTYLVNAIANGGRMTPYSFVEAGPVPPDMPDDHVLINEWLAEQIGAEPGDSLDVAYSKLLPNNTFVEQQRQFTVHSVIPMDRLAVERELAPVFPGLSDVETCSDWDIGMPMDATRLKDEANEAYWRRYRQTPKLLTTFKAGQATWGNQFGSVTAIRFASPGLDEAQVRTLLREKIRAEAIGLQFAPVKDIAVNAVAQATDFGGLFVGMSVFLIVAALILLGLLYVFGLQQRASEMGVLLAVGFPRWRVRALLLLEACPTALAGAALGALAGVVYARLLLAGLAWLWPAAVANTVVQLHVAPAHVILGTFTGILCALLVVWGCVWRATRRTSRELMTSDYASMPPALLLQPTHMYRFLLLPALAFLLAIGLAANAWRTNPQSLVEPFFSVGTLLLLAELGCFWWILRYLACHGSFRRVSLAKMALANLARRRGRSLSVAGLTACGCLLVFSVSSMQENLALHAGERDSGTGGFALFAETTVPITVASEDIAKTLGVEAVPLKVRDGDDAGCLNLNRAQTPRLFGVHAEKLSTLRAFVPGSGNDTLWPLLNKQLPDGVIPALAGDANTALWGLQKKTGPDDGDVVPYRDESGREFKLKLVGQLPMRLSVFQGSLLISDEAFARLFPSEAGYRAFLVEAPPEKGPEIAARLNRDFERFGMEAVPASQRLQEFYSVEATYLAMFLVLGGLGLVFGAGGAGIVVLRNVFERRTEIGVLHAVGYDKTTVFRILFAEHALLILSGTVLGALAAGASILPLVLLSQTTVSTRLQAMLFGAIILANVMGVVAGLWAGLPRDPVQHLRAE